MFKFNKHQWLSLFYIAFGAVIIILSKNIKYLFSVAEGDVGPKFFPICCGVGLIICGIGKFFSSKDKKSKPFIKDAKGWLRVLLMFAVLVAYLLGMKYIGYIISTFAFAAVVLRMLSSDAEKLPRWKILLFAALMTLFSYVCFEKIINVMLPQGRWTKALLRALRRR